jgi:hypothetical protein
LESLLVHAIKRLIIFDSIGFHQELQFPPTRESLQTIPNSQLEPLLIKREGG